MELTAVSPRAATAAVVAERPSPPEPSLELVLYQSLIRPQRFELVLEKGTELGVSRFVRLQRWRRIVTEAAEQSGRGRVPAIDPPSLFEDAVRSAPGLLLLPWEGERSRSLRSYLRSLGDRPLAASLFIGPEGGFAEDEVRLAREAGCVPISLGPRILRSETAGIVAAALVMHELGEMGG